MADLRTTYLGIPIKNPIVVAASGLCATLAGVEKAAKAGAGAITLKSLFEEQIQADVDVVEATQGSPSNAEAAEYLRGMGLHVGAGEDLNLIRAAKKAVDVPIIASINCASGPWWTDFAEQVEAAGADAIELNIGFIPSDPAEGAAAIEDRIVGIVHEVSTTTSLPIAVKLGASFTNLGHLAARLSGAGALALVLFNRFYRIDVDLDAMSLKAGPTRSHDDDYHESLRWIAMLDGRVSCELIGANGVHDAEAALRLIAAGAHAVQVCSVAYEGGYEAIGRIAHAMDARLDALGVKHVQDLRGRLSRRSSEHPEAYGRAQYVRALTGIS